MRVFAERVTYASACDNSKTINAQFGKKLFTQQIVFGFPPTMVCQRSEKIVLLEQVKVDVGLWVIKCPSTNWIISGWQALEKRSEVDFER